MNKIKTGQSMIINTVADCKSPLLKEKNVLVRVDFNVPLQDGNISDDTRIKHALPTIQYILDKGGMPILCTHFKRPDGFDPDYSTKFLVDVLGDYFKGYDIHFIDHVDFDFNFEINSDRYRPAYAPKTLYLMDNIRFHEGEARNAESVALGLSKLADIYVNEAFSCCHRSHASIDKVTAFLPSFAGFALSDEVQKISMLLGHSENSKKPLCVCIGGAKISTKLPVIQNLLYRADMIIVGGGMANTFLKASGIDIGDSLYEADFTDVALDLLEQSKTHPHFAKIVMPHHVVAESASGKDAYHVDLAKSALHNQRDRILDVSPAFFKEKAISDMIASAKMILWNGPFGYFENPDYAAGTLALAKLIGASDQAFKIVGGGDSVSAINQLGMQDQFDHISTAGGAFLEAIEGKILPGVRVLSS